MFRIISRRPVVPTFFPTRSCASTAAPKIADIVKPKTDLDHAGESGVPTTFVGQEIKVERHGIFHRREGKPETLYEQLGVGVEATRDEVKKAYHAKAKEFHPDVVQEEQLESAQVAFAKSQAAYEVLAKPSTRRMYNIAMRVRDVQHNAKKFRDDPTRGASRFEDFLARYLEPVLKFCLPERTYQRWVLSRRMNDSRTRNEYCEDDAPTAAGPASQNIWFLGYPLKRETQLPWGIIKCSVAFWVCYLFYQQFYYTEKVWRWLRRLPGQVWKFKFMEFYATKMRPYTTEAVLGERELNAYEAQTGGWQMRKINGG